MKKREKSNKQNKPTRNITEKKKQELRIKHIRKIIKEEDEKTVTYERMSLDQERVREWAIVYKHKNKQISYKINFINVNCKWKM